MNSLFNAEEDVPVRDMPQRVDREISLGASTILGIFFALSLIGAVIFGAGYTFGRRSVQPSPAPQAAAAAPGASEASSESPFANFKPSPGSAASGTSSPGKPAQAATPRAAGGTSAGSTATPAASSVGPAASNPAPASSTPTEAASSRVPAKPPAAAARPAAVVIAPPPPNASARTNAPIPTANPLLVTAPGSAVVQIAAVSHQEDADVLVSALKRRGYAVAVRQEPQDRLLHIQVGPFANHKDAEAMRQRLLADGYNAIVK